MNKLEIIPFSRISEHDWTSFHQSCIDPVLFYQYPFISAYREATKGQVDLLIFTESDKLLIALPGRFDKKKNTFHNLTYLGWDNLNFMMDKSLHKNTIQAFFTELFEVVDLVVYNNISQTCYHTIAKYTVGGISFKRFKCPFIGLPNSYQAYIDTLSVSFKRMIKNRTNFCEKHGVEFRFLLNKDEGSLDEAFIELNRLHAIRMGEMDTESKFLKSDSQRFHQVIQQENKEAFILIVQAVESEKVIGTLYGFVSSNRYAYFAAGIDPNYSKYSLGVVLIGRVIDYLISNKYKYFDFLRGTEDYKYRWTKDNNQNYTVYSFANTFGKFKAMKEYWQENKRRLGRKQTLVNLKKFL